jgi:hypothetical protein
MCPWPDRAPLKSQTAPFWQDLKRDDHFDHVVGARQWKATPIKHKLRDNGKGLLWKGAYYSSPFLI